MSEAVVAGEHDERSETRGQGEEALRHRGIPDLKTGSASAKLD